MPRYGKRLSQQLEKAKDSALLAISIYNNPKTSFRTSGFLVMICIAWTSLLHASFEKKKIKYYYKDKKKSTPKRIRYEKRDGENKAWELLQCIKQAFSTNNSTYKNLDFLYKLRNKIEHRFLPQIDMEVLGECQACVLNFERFLVSEFGERHSIVGEFCVPLQMTLGVRELPKLEKNKILTFINNYRNSLSDDLVDDQNFATKFYLMPKIGNHKNSSDYAFEFIKIDDLSEDEKVKLNKFVIGIKNKRFEVEKKKYLPSEIWKHLQNLGYDDFKQHQHTQLWKNNDAKNSEKKFGVQVANTWYWYQNWLNYVIKYCEETND